jgi:hypothetical protein
MRWLTVTHTQRIARPEPAPCTRAVSSRSRGEEDDHLLTVLRYVERSPLRANMVQEAEA